MISLRFALVSCVLIAACGDDGGGDDDDVIDAAPGTPVRTPGGGVVNPGINGTLNVFVVDSLNDTPVEGAKVRVETNPPLEGVTDAAGLATFTDGALTGPQTVTVTGMIYLDAATWVGVAGRDVTIPLGQPPPAVPSAIVSGTIAGWDNLPAPAFGNYNLGVVLATFTDDIAAPENNLVQPTPGGTPTNTCVRSALSNNCAWTLVARTGQQRHFAVIVEGDPNGTTSDISDDTYRLIGYAIGSSVTLADQQSMSGESLTIVPAGELTDLQVNLQQPPNGLSKVIAIPQLDLGADGRVVFPLPTLTPANRTTKVLAPSGRFAGTYDLVTLATPAGTAATPYATSFARGLTSVSSVMATSWIAPPTAITVTGADASFTAPASSIRYATFVSGTTPVWRFALLDGSSSFTRPPLERDPLTSGQMKLEVTAADVTGFSAGDFHAVDLHRSLARASGATITFNH